MWNKKFKLPDESYSISENQDYFKYIIEKHKYYIWNENNEANSWSNEIRSTKSEITKNKNGENISHIEITEADLFHCIYWTIIMN